jgi:hypothetical protein
MKVDESRLKRWESVIRCDETMSLDCLFATCSFINWGLQLGGGTVMKPSAGAN